MKSFSQFLEESYFSEEEAVQGRLLNRKNQAYKDINNPNPGNRGYATDPTPTSASRRLPAGAPEGAKTSPGQLEIPEPKTTKVSGSQFRNAGEARQGSLLTKSGGAQNFTKAGKGRVPFTSSEPVKATKNLPAAAPEAPKVSPGQMDIDFNAKPNKGGALVKTSSSTPATKAGKLATRSSTKPATNPPIQAVNVRDITKKPKALPSSGATKPSVSVGKPPTGLKPSSVAKSSGALRKLGKLAGPLGVAADVGLETMDQKSRGRKTGSALAMGATKAAGGLVGAKAGAATGAAIGSLAGPVGTAVGAGVGGIGGYLAGSGIAGKASETVAGATGKEKAAMATANRQKQAGTAIKGIGGQTTFSQKKPGGPAFMSTGSGSQRKTVQLAKTGVVQRGGQSVAGNLAFKDGKAVYKAGPSAQSLAKTSSNPLERIGRSLFAGAYKKSDAAAAAKKLATARQSDAARNKALGVKFKPAG
jgi:hypothetical protein